MLIQISMKLVQGSNWQYVITGSDNGLATNRRQAITWANVDPDLCRHSASLGHNELKLAIFIGLVAPYAS